MPLLKERDRQALAEQFAEMSAPVRILFFTRASECETCSITEQILDKVAPLGDKIELVKLDYAEAQDAAQRYGIVRIPAFAWYAWKKIRERTAKLHWLNATMGFGFMVSHRAMSSCPLSARCWTYPPAIPSFHPQAATWSPKSPRPRTCKSLPLPPDHTARSRCDWLIGWQSKTQTSAPIWWRSVNFLNCQTGIRCMAFR